MFILKKWLHVCDVFKGISGVTEELFFAI